MNALNDIRESCSGLPSTVSFEDVATLEIQSLEPNGFTVCAPPGLFSPAKTYSIEMPVLKHGEENVYRSRAVLSCVSAKSQTATFFILSDALY